MIVLTECLAIYSFIDPVLNYINTDKNIKSMYDCYRVYLCGNMLLPEILLRSLC
jgi:hypothetical protein